jgi:hypothetical protein
MTDDDETMSGLREPRRPALHGPTARAYPWDHEHGR